MVANSSIFENISNSSNSSNSSSLISSIAVSHLSVDLIIFLTCVFGLAFAAYNAWWVSKIKLHSVKVTKKKDLELNQEKLLAEEDNNEQEEEVEKESVDLIIEIGEHISSVY